MRKNGQECENEQGLKLKWEHEQEQKQEWKRRE